MKLKFTLLPLLLLYSCWATTEVVEVIRPVKLYTVQPLELYSKEFIGSLSPINSTTLAFNLSNIITDIAPSTGSAVSKGEFIAQIDPAEYILKVEAEKSSYLADSAAYERSTRLLSKGAVSIQENEMSRARLEASRARYLYAISELNSTTLRAPFSGSIEAFYVDIYQNIVAGEAICKLIDPTSLEVDFTLPQNDLPLITSGSTYHIKIQNKLYTTTLKEVVDASVDGAGIPVSLRITDPKFNPQKLGIKAGFPCIVKINLNDSLTSGSYTTIPLTALCTTEITPTKNFVWLYNQATSQVERRDIIIGSLFGTDKIIVSSGLSPNDIVVSAGVALLNENQSVKPL